MNVAAGGVAVAVAFLTSGCDSGTSTAPVGSATASAEAERGCAHCTSSETCVVETSHARSEGHCAVIVVPRDVLDESRPRKWQEVPNLRDGVMDKLVLLKGVHFGKGRYWETQMACADDRNCCNLCGAAAVLDGFGEIPVYDPDGKAAGCGGGCCKQECSPWLPKEERAVDVAGRFESGLGSRELLPSIYFKLAILPSP